MSSRVSKSEGVYVKVTVTKQTSTPSANAKRGALFSLVNIYNTEQFLFLFQAHL